MASVYIFVGDRRAPKNNAAGAMNVNDNDASVVGGWVAAAMDSIALCTPLLCARVRAHMCVI